LLLGLASLLTMPAAIEVAARSKRIDLLNTVYAVPLAFVLGLVALVMAWRARNNLRWLQLRDGSSRLATAAVVVSAIALCLAIVAALSAGFYEIVVLYQHSR
jgi:H+/Cl- antiporter ClcA